MTKLCLLGSLLFVIAGGSPLTAWQTQTGQDSLPSLYTAKYLVDDKGDCSTALAQNLWGQLDPTSQKWSSFDISKDLPARPLPQMEPYLNFECQPKATQQKSMPILIYAALWRVGAGGQWSQVTGQLQVYRAVDTHKSSADKKPVQEKSENSQDNKVVRVSLLSDGYQRPRKGAPAVPAAWEAKSPLYNDEQAKFVGLSCFYDWDGANLQDPARISSLAVTYKIGTTPVTPDDLSSLDAILGALVSIPAAAPAIAQPPPPPIKTAVPSIALSPLYISLVPGDRVRFRAYADSVPVPPQSLTWTVMPSAAGTMDKFGTLTVASTAQPNSTLTITAMDPSGKRTSGTAMVMIPAVLSCLMTSGDVQTSSLPSDITVTMTVADSNQTKNPAQDPLPSVTSASSQRPDPQVISKSTGFDTFSISQSPLPRTVVASPEPEVHLSPAVFRSAVAPPMNPAAPSPKGAINSTNNQQQPASSDCSSVASTGCSTTRTIRAYDREWWDLGLGLSVPGVLEPQYLNSGGKIKLTGDTRHTDVYGFANFFPFAAEGNKTSYFPSLVAGIPVTGQVFYRPFFGLSENVTGWHILQSHAFPIQINFLAGVVFMNQEFEFTSPQGISQIDHTRIWKPMFGLELPVSALASKITGLGGGGGGSKPSGNSKQQ
jgi:hypothetical protein